MHKKRLRNVLKVNATRIIFKQEDDSSAEASKVGAGHVAANTIRLLIAGSQAGSLIGMSGQNIEKLRNSSGAMITVLAQNQLPLCASAHESDRVVQVRIGFFFFSNNHCQQFDTGSKIFE